MARLTKVKDPRLKGLPNRLQQLAQAHGGVTGLAKKAHVATSSLSRCANGACEPGISLTLAICTATGASLNWLIAGDTASSPAAERVQIPFFDIEASAGPGIEPGENESPSAFVSVPAAVLQRTTARDLGAIQSKGDSMEPTIRSGSLLVVDRSDKQIREGIFVILRGESLLVKRLQPREKNVLRLKSDNERYEPEDVSMDDASQAVRIVGRVIWSGHAI